MAFGGLQGTAGKRLRVRGKFFALPSVVNCGAGVNLQYGRLREVITVDGNQLRSWGETANSCYECEGLVLSQLSVRRVEKVCNRVLDSQIERKFSRGIENYHSGCAEGRAMLFA